MPGMAARALPHNLSAWGMFLSADVVVKIVMISLAFASLVTWTIFLAKSLEIAAAWRQMHAGRALLSAARSLNEAMPQLRARHCPIAALVAAAHEESIASADIPGEVRRLHLRNADEAVHDAPDGAEQPHEGSGRADRGENPGGARDAPAKACFADE